MQRGGLVGWILYEAAALLLVYLLLYGTHRPQLWEVYPYAGGPPPATAPSPSGP